MKRALTFAFIFLAVAVMVFGSIFLFNMDAFVTFFKNRQAMSEGSEWVEKTYSLKALTEYIEANPEHVSVASIVISKPDSAIYFESSTPHTLGTLGNIFIIAGMLNAFENDTLNPDSTFSWVETDRYLLPGVYESDHQNSKSEALENGWIKDGEISYYNALKILARGNSMPLSDYFRSRFDHRYWTELVRKSGLENTDTPLPFSGLYLAISPAIQGKSFDGIKSEWNRLSDKEWEQLVIDSADKFAKNDSVRNRYVEILNERRIGLNFTEERDALAMFPKTTALEMVKLLQNIIEKQFISESVSSKILELIEWADDQQVIRRNFENYGAIYDNRMGLLSGIDVGTSAYTGDTTVQAVFFDRIPISFWFHMSSNYMHQDFQQRLIYDPALIETMNRVSNQ